MRAARAALLAGAALACGSHAAPLELAALSSSTDHSCGIKRNGVLVCWGDNEDGGLGNGSRQPSFTARPVAGALSFRIVAAGGSNSCGIAVDSTAYCWGEGAMGQVGYGVMADTATPVRLSGGLAIAAIAQSYERIHRSNLVGMGILPLQFGVNETAASLGLTGEEVFEFTGLGGLLAEGFPQGKALTVKATRRDASTVSFTTTIRIDTPQELQYYRHGGILEYVLRQLAAAPA